MGYDVYHYTSMKNFQSILASLEHDPQNFTFRGSSILYMNDPSELRYGYTMLMKRFLPEVEKRLSVKDEYKITKIWESTSNEKEAEYNNAFFEHLNDCNEIPFIISFSTKKDDFILWNKYGNKGKGVCLVFKEHDMKTKIERNSNVDIQIENDIELSDTIYEHFEYEDIKQKHLNRLYEDYIDKIKKLTSKKEIIQFKISYLSLFTVVFSPYLKKKNFEFEREKRMIKYQNDLDKVKYRCGEDDNLIPYIDIKIPVYNLKEVIIGAGAKTDLTKKALTSQLKKYPNLKNIRVTISELSSEQFK